jgi:hypothetical protein
VGGIGFPFVLNQHGLKEKEFFVLILFLKSYINSLTKKKLAVPTRVNKNECGRWVIDQRKMG